MKSVVTMFKKVVSVFELEEYKFDQKKNVDVQEVSQDKLIKMIASLR